MHFSTISKYLLLNYECIFFTLPLHWEMWHQREKGREERDDGKDNTSPSSTNGVPYEYMHLSELFVAPFSRFHLPVVIHGLAYANMKQF